VDLRFCIMRYFPEREGKQMTVKLPIRQLVELIMRSGDIDSRYVSKDRLLEGAKAHRMLQKSYRQWYGDYRSEVFLALAYNYQGVDYLLEGRADGVFFQDGLWVIDEIKTTTRPLIEITPEHHPTYWAQAKCYAYIWAVQNGAAQVAVQLTYCHLETGETQQFRKVFATGELERFLASLIESYAVWANFSTQWAKERDLSIAALEFPFAAYRRGQRELAVAAYRAIAGGKKLFAEAPTGTGKTISVLFPAVKALGEGKIAKIFYLTAKTITRQVAEEAFARMRRNGLKIKTLTLTAKEKICFCEKTVCQPDYCQYAKGHFDRVNAAILDILKECDDLTRSVVERYAAKHRVCPFEFSLDLSLWADCVICDYNYLFDPRAYLRRFFAEGKNDYAFLIDEAHNLVDRSREMFSAEFRKSAMSEIKKAYKGRHKPLDKVATAINREMLALRKQCGEQGYAVCSEKPLNLLKLIARFTAVCEEMLKEDQELGEDSRFLQLYFEGLHFLTIAEFYDQRYTTLIEVEGREVKIKLFCLDPSQLLRDALKRGSSTVMFSATFSPLPYFRDILGGDDIDGTLSLDSPFDRRRLCVLIADHVSTKYHDRRQSLPELIRLIGAFVSAKVGNYIVYLPSYEYLEDVFAEFAKTYPHITAAKQQGMMAENEREQFLENFQENPPHTYVAFCVLGGIFGEGIDLQGSRLIGTVIVGVGLPQVNV